MADDPLSGSSGGTILGGAASGAAAGSMFGPWGAVAGMVIGAIGGLVSATGASAAGQAQANMYNYRAAIARMNSKIALQNADYERYVGEVQVQEVGMKTRAQVGATTAAQASSGLDINRGSAADVRASEVEIGQQDQAIVRANSARRAYGYEVEATQDVAQAGLYEMAAKTGKIAGDISATTSLLSAGTSVASKWQQGQQLGVFNSGNPTNVGSAIQYP